MLARLAGVATGPDEISYRPTLEEEERSLRREILDAAGAEMDAREDKAGAMRDAETRKVRIEELKRLRDARKRRR